MTRERIANPSIYIDGNSRTMLRFGKHAFQVICWIRLEKSTASNSKWLHEHHNLPYQGHSNLLAHKAELVE